VLIHRVKVDSEKCEMVVAGVSGQGSIFRFPL
jgi:hypothetical protein